MHDVILKKNMKLMTMTMWMKRRRKKQKKRKKMVELVSKCAVDGCFLCGGVCGGGGVLVADVQTKWLLAEYVVVAGSAGSAGFDGFDGFVDFVDFVNFDDFVGLVVDLVNSVCFVELAHFVAFVALFGATAAHLSMQHLDNASNNVHFVCCASLVRFGGYESCVCNLNHVNHASYANYENHAKLTRSVSSESYVSYVTSAELHPG